MPAGDIVDRLAALHRFADVPRAELEWVAARGEIRHCTAGTILAEAGGAVDEMYVVLEGRAAVYLDKGGSWRKSTEAAPGEIIGAVPYSRMRAAPARLAVEDDSTVFALSRIHFDELLRNCPALTAALVHGMIDRSRADQMARLQEDRLQSLGRLAAGLAHELNNPASAASSSAQTLGELLGEAEETARALAAAHLTDAQFDALDAVRSVSTAPTAPRSPLEIADREDLFAAWLDRHGIESRAAEALAASHVRIVDLEQLAAALPAQTLDVAIRWVTSGSAADAVAQQIASATARIHRLVDAVKRFTFMDRESVPGDIDVRQGLVDTLAMLENKTKRLSVEVRLDVAADLPRVQGFGSEINQVWEKLIDNAIDAAGPSGHVSVTATSQRDRVVVQVTDAGPGISERNRSRVFEPFFTTKPVGQATGLGLHLARRVVLFHHGDIDFTSEPGRTTFRVRLPVTSSASSPSEA